MTLAQGRISRFTPPDDPRADAEEIEEIARSRVERARIDILLSLLSLRRADNVTDAAVSTPGSQACSAGRTSSTLGHGARWIDPCCHHDHTSSVANGKKGAKSRSCTDRARSSAAWADAAVLR
jgi:hypothetical protein